MCPANFQSNWYLKKDAFEWPCFSIWVTTLTACVIIANETLPQPLIMSFFISLDYSVWAWVFYCQALYTGISVFWSMLTYLRNGSLFSYPSCSILLSLAASYMQPAGCQGGGVSWVDRRWRGRSKQGLCICPSEFSVEGTTHGQMIFSVNCRFVPWFVFLSQCISVI